MLLIPLKSWSVILLCYSIVCVCVCAGVCVCVCVCVGWPSDMKPQIRYKDHIVSLHDPWTPCTAVKRFQRPPPSMLPKGIQNRKFCFQDKTSPRPRPGHTSSDMPDFRNSLQLNADTFPNSWQLSVLWYIAHMVTDYFRFTDAFLLQTL